MRDKEERIELIKSSTQQTICIDSDTEGESAHHRFPVSTFRLSQRLGLRIKPCHHHHQSNGCHLSVGSDSERDWMDFIKFIS